MKATCSYILAETDDSIVRCNRTPMDRTGPGIPVCSAHENATGAGWVYVIQWGEYIKIGYSVDPSARVINLGRETDLTLKPPTHQPGLPVLLGYVPGSRTTEALVHAVLATDRVKGEWFTKTAAVLRAVEFVTGPRVSVDRRHEVVPEPEPTEVIEF